MNPRNLLLAAAAVTAVGVGSLLYTPAPVPAWKPKPGKHYPRIIQPRNMSNADYTKLMESKAKDWPPKK